MQATKTATVTVTVTVTVNVTFAVYFAFILQQSQESTNCIQMKQFTLYTAEEAEYVKKKNQFSIKNCVFLTAASTIIKL